MACVDAGWQNGQGEKECDGLASARPPRASVSTPVAMRHQAAIRQNRRRTSAGTARPLSPVSTIAGAVPMPNAVITKAPRNIECELADNPIRKVAQLLEGHRHLQIALEAGNE